MASAIKDVVTRYFDGHSDAYNGAAVVVEVSPSGEVIKAEKTGKKESPEMKETVVEGTMASVIVSYVQDAKIYSSVLVLLLEETWSIISDCRSWMPNVGPETRMLETKTTSEDIAGAAEGANAYCEANRAIDGAAMSKVFTDFARLTFVLPDGGLKIISAPEFCSMVTNRWSSPKHKAYAHLKDDPRLAQADSLLSVSLAGPRLAVVKLRVVFPPVAFTDLLTYSKFPDGVWKIIAKSTNSEPFLKDEALE